MRTALMLALAFPVTLAAQIQRPSRTGTPVVAEPQAPVFTAVPTAPIEAELRRVSAIAAPAGFITVRLREDQGGVVPQNGDYLPYLRVERM